MGHFSLTTPIVQTVFCYRSLSISSLIISVLYQFPIVIVLVHYFDTMKSPSVKTREVNCVVEEKLQQVVVVVITFFLFVVVDY
jgi:hypothetical protein